MRYNLTLLAAPAALALAAPAAVAQTQFTDLLDWQAAANPVFTYEFEDFAPGTVITDQYATTNVVGPVGVIFSSTDGLDIADAADIQQQTQGSPVSGTQALDVIGGSTDALLAQFVIPGTTTPASVPAAGGWMIDLNTFGDGVVQFFDVDGNLIDTVVAAAPGTDENQFFGLVTAPGTPGISTVIFDGEQSGEFVIVDDFAYGLVPEPTTAGLAAAAAGLLLQRRRRR